MSSVVLSGDSSGSVTLTVPSAAGSNTVTFPATTGTVALNGTTITQATAVATTSGTSIDFTSIPSWVKRIIVSLDSVSTSGTANLLVQIGDSGGIETTSYVSASTSSGTDTTSTAGYVIRSAVATNSTSGLMTLVNITGNTWVASFAGATASTAVTGGGTKATSATLDRVRLTTSNGTDTFDAGSVNILYEG